MNATQSTIEPEDYRQAVLPKLLVLVVLGGGLFLNSLSGIWTPDEERTLFTNPVLQNPGASTWLSSQRLTHATLLLNRAMAPQSRMGYHVVNLLIHVLAGLTLFGIVCRTLLRQQNQPRLQEAAPWLALLIALLWMLHPLQTQSVTHLSGRSAALAGLCYLLTLYGLIRGAEAEFGLPWYALAVLGCALGMGSNPVMVTVPLAALLFDRIYLSSSFAELFQRRAGLYAALAVCWGLLALPLLAPEAAAPDGLGSTPAVATYVLTQPGVILHYLRLTFWPVGLSVDYSDYPPAQALSEALPGLVVLLVLLAATAWALVRWPRVGFLGAWFFLTLLPASLVPSPELVNESRTYLPLAAVSAGLVLGGFGLVVVVGKSQTWALAASLVVAVGLIATLGFLTFHRNYTHASPLELWQQTVAVRPGNVRAHLYLGNVLLQERKPDRAAAEYQFVLEASPSAPGARELRGLALQLLGTALIMDNRSEEALKAVCQFSGPDLETATTLNNLGFTEWTNKNTDMASRFFEKASSTAAGRAQVSLQPRPGAQGQRRAEESGGSPEGRSAPGFGLSEDRPGAGLAEGHRCRPPPAQRRPGPLPGRDRQPGHSQAAAGSAGHPGGRLRHQRPVRGRDQDGEEGPRPGGGPEK